MNLPIAIVIVVAAIGLASRRCSGCGARLPMAVTFTTATAPLAYSVCSPPDLPYSSGSWSSWPSRATTRHEQEPSPRRARGATGRDRSALASDGVRELTAELVCYARSVVGVQWDRMEAGTLGEDLNPWAVKLFRYAQARRPETPTEQAAYSKWLDERSDARRGPRDRIHGALGVIPTPLWLVLFFIAGLIFVFMLFFADSGERAVVQALLMGTVVAVVVSMLLLLQFLDHPFHAGIGGLRPDAMERTLKIIDQDLDVTGQRLQLPCDARGNAV